jgi:hypothetical protein
LRNPGDDPERQQGQPLRDAEPDHRLAIPMDFPCRIAPFLVAAFSAKRFEISHVLVPELGVRLGRVVYVESAASGSTRLTGIAVELERACPLAFPMLASVVAGGDGGPGHRLGTPIVLPKWSAYHKTCQILEEVTWYPDAPELFASIIRVGVFFA